jgi:hypothetical protein
MGGLIATERSLPDNLWMDRSVRKKHIIWVVIGIRDQIKE